MKSAIANIITTTRLIAAVLMLLVSATSLHCWLLYAWCGISDMIDGPISRKLGTHSAFGSRLDSASDFAFVVVCLITLLPLIDLPVWLVLWIALIALCKVSSIISALVMVGRPLALHTYANKAAGLLLFFTVPLLVLARSPLLAIPACFVATIAAIQEGHLIRTGHK